MMGGRTKEDRKGGLKRKKAFAISSSTASQEERSQPNKAPSRPKLLFQPPEGLYVNGPSLCISLLSLMRQSLSLLDTKVKTTLMVDGRRLSILYYMRGGPPPSMYKSFFLGQAQILLFRLRLLPSQKKPGRPSLYLPE